MVYHGVSRSHCKGENVKIQEIAPNHDKWHFGATNLHQTITSSCIFSTGATGQALGDFS